jgi:Zn-dependent protease with chaperone function
MRVAVYLPWVLSMLAAVLARYVAGRFEPRMATWLLAVTALVLAGASGFTLTALAATAVGQIPLVGAMGDWSVSVLRRDDPASLTLGLAASVLLITVLGAAARVLWKRGRDLIEAARVARWLPTTERGSQLVVVDDPIPDAYALPGLPGRIVVSTGMFDALTERERSVVLSHEQAHLVFGHHLFLALTRLAAAANPLLAPMVNAVGYSTERWADEYAAEVTGDRRLVAATIGKAALLTRRRPNRSSVALGITPGFIGRLRGPGPVPRRVAALLVDSPRGRWFLLFLTLGILAVTTAATLEAARDLDALFDLAALR